MFRLLKQKYYRLRLLYLLFTSTPDVLPCQLSHAVETKSGPSESILPGILLVQYPHKVLLGYFKLELAYLALSKKHSILYGGPGRNRTAVQHAFVSKVIQQLIITC